MRLKKHSASFLVLIALVVLVGGCTQQRAKNKLRKTSEKVADIKNNYDGLKFEEAAIKGVEQKIDSANQQLAGDASQALATAQQAEAETEQVLARVKPAQGSALYTQAEQDIAVARRNRLDRNDSVRFQKITEIKAKADEARAANKWDDLIKLSRQVVEEVRIGIEPLKNEADRKQAEATQRLTELNREGGRDLAPEVVIAVEDEIERAKKVSVEERDYNLAANGFQAAKARADQGINQVLREKARIGIEELEGLLTSSVIEGVKQFKPEAYDRVTKVYDELVRENEAGSYSRVITGVTNIKPEAQQLVVDTKRAASDDRIQTLQSNIKELEQGGILEYLPNSLDNLRNSLAQETETRKADDEKAFDTIKQMSIEASDEYDRVRGQFESLANDRIRDARNSVDKSRAVFERLDSIFDPIEGPMNEDQQAFENQKQARKTELGKQLESATDNLGAAELRKNQGNFKGAIVLAGEVVALSENTLSEIYHTVAHNATIELSKLVSRYERDGARVHAPEELARATGKLEQVKASVAQHAYQRAVEESAEARAEVELLAQRIAGRAAENIRDAGTALEAANNENVRRFHPEALPQISALIQQASVDLQSNNLKLALEKAAEATQEALMDYHLYGFERPTTIADNQTKQLALLSASAVPTRREYLLAGNDWYYRDRYGQIGQKLKPAVFLEFDNKGSLGKPLPAGTVRVYARDSKGAAQFVGEDRIEHTAKNEVVRLRLGEAFDITAERRQTNYRRIADNQSESSWRIELRNAKEEAAAVKVLEPMPGDWEMVQESQRHTKESARAASWAVAIPAGGSTVLDYTVRVRW
ncbi:MAG TPA: hypothetical protein PKD58_00670 [Candidatus Sumerlaeota bacterium]|nr:hypothetical protein [Candidatus Sumerlaeota bacterium]